MAITPTGLPKRIAPGRTGFTKPAPPKRAPGPYPLPPSPKRAPGPGTPGPLPPPPTPAGPIGQGYLTEFDEGIPQLFRGIPGTIGGGAMGNIDPQRLFHGLSQVGGLRQRAEYWKKSHLKVNWVPRGKQADHRDCAPGACGASRRQFLKSLASLRASDHQL